MTRDPSPMSPPSSNTSWVQLNARVRQRAAGLTGFIVSINYAYDSQGGQNRTTVDVHTGDYGMAQVMRFDWPTFISMWDPIEDPRVAAIPALQPPGPNAPASWVQLSTKVVCTTACRLSTFCTIPAGTRSMIRSLALKHPDRDRWQVELSIEDGLWPMRYEWFMRHWQPEGRAMQRAATVKTAYDLLDDE